MKYPPYRIETARLVLRCWNPEDAPLLKAAVDQNIEHLKPFMPWAHHEPTDLQTKVDLLRFFRSEFDRSRDFVYGIFSQDETEVWGGCGLHRRDGPECLEIGYWVAKEHEGKGYAREVSLALTKAAFALEGIDRVEIHHDPANERSGRVPEALGFHFQSLRKRNNTTFPGEFRDTKVWVKYRE